MEIIIACLILIAASLIGLAGLAAWGVYSVARSRFLFRGPTASPMRRLVRS